VNLRRQGWRKFAKFAVTSGSGRRVADRVEERREGGDGLGLRVGIAALFPRQREPLRVEPGEEPGQELVAGHPAFGDQNAVFKDLVDAALHGAVEHDRGQPADGKLERAVPGGREGGRAGAQLVGGARR
jgi:hypothetical protein